MPHVSSKSLWHACWLGGSILLLVVLFAGCGGATTMTASSMPANTTGMSSQGGQSSSSTGSAAKTGSTKALDAPQYLIKTLKVGMNVKDPRKVANDLQTWITTTDPHATSAGTDYEQLGDDYSVSISFSVQASIYPQIEQYLRNYAPQKGGYLTSLTESVQDVTNDFVDTQSRLKNLKGEQTRLLDLLSHAQVLGDIISIQDKLTDIEGQIENIEAHLNLLSNQTTFYTVSISLQPIAATASPQPVATGGWNVGQIFHDAFAASLSLAQGLLAFFIWILAFCVYIVPVALIILFAARWRSRPHRIAPETPKSSTTLTPPTSLT